MHAGGGEHRGDDPGVVDEHEHGRFFQRRDGHADGHLDLGLIDLGLIDPGLIDLGLIDPGLIDPGLIDVDLR